jgi:hypothetical protein
LNEDDGAFVTPQTKEKIMNESKSKIYALIILVANPRTYGNAINLENVSAAPKSV